MPGSGHLLYDPATGNLQHGPDGNLLYDGVQVERKLGEVGILIILREIQLTNFVPGNAIIRYTLDETDPSRTNGITYTGVFSVSEYVNHFVLKVMSYLDGWIDSDEQVEDRTIPGS